MPSSTGGATLHACGQEAARWCSSAEARQGSIAREAGFDEAEIAKLRALGHNVGSPGSIGNVNAIFIDLATGHQYGAVDSTREGGLIGLPKGHRGKEDD